MEKQNDWLEMNIREINGLARQLINYHMKGSYGGEIQLLQIERLLRGAVDQILRLQKEVNTLTEGNEKLEEMLKLKQVLQEKTAPVSETPPPMSPKQAGKETEVEVSDA